MKQSTKLEVHNVLQNVRGATSHGHRQHAQKIGKDRACGSEDILADRQTHVLITIFRNLSRGQSIKNSTK